MSSYSIYTGNGTQVTAGVQGIDEARRIAKDAAERHGDEVEICDAATGELVEVVG